MNFFTQSEKRKSTMAWSKRAELLTTILWLIKRLIVKKPQQALFMICRKKVLQFRYLWNFSTVSQVCNTWSPTFLRIYFLLSCFRQAQDFVIFKGPKIFFSITDQLLFPAVTDVISFLLSKWGTKYDAINCFEKQLCEYFN